MRIRITKEQLEAVFAEAKEQADYLIGIYRLVFPEWDQIERIDHWPSVNDFTWKAIARMAMDWDQQHVDCLAGGAWMNHGFSTSHGEKCANWEVSLKGVKLTMKKAERSPRSPGPPEGQEAAQAGRPHPTSEGRHQSSLRPAGE